MKTNRHQLEIAADRIRQAQGSLAKTISVLNKAGLVREGGYIATTLGELNAAAEAAINAVPAAGTMTADTPQPPQPHFEAGAQTFARKVDAAPVAATKAAEDSDILPAE